MIFFRFLDFFHAYPHKAILGPDHGYGNVVDVDDHDTDVGDFWVTPVLVFGLDTEDRQVRVFIAGLGHGVGARAHEIKGFPIEGKVVGIAGDPAG